MTLKKKLSEYVEKFNRDDEEIIKNLIDNAHAKEWLEENAPLLDCPDKTLEEIYYFRWWTFRKHIKYTEDGYVVTEFLPPLNGNWLGKHGTIMAPAAYHMAEAKWLKSGKKIVEDYALLWLEDKSGAYPFSSWFLDTLWECSVQENDYSFGIQHLDLLIRYYEKTADEHQSSTGLFWCTDDMDAMEWSISGSEVAENGPDRQPGIRPTLNSYMAANARAIANFARKAGREDIAARFDAEYKRLKKLLTELLWDGGFYKACHSRDLNNLPKVTELAPHRNCRELHGYIPWWFKLAPEGYDKAFETLKDDKGFRHPYGLTTAEQSHPCFLYKFDEVNRCFWNGYIWPFATSHVLYAVNSLLENYEQDTMTKEDFYDILSGYAKCHYRTMYDGRRICWIDEEIDPRTGTWKVRISKPSGSNYYDAPGVVLKEGEYRRGRDYNHSVFCDIVLHCLLGIKCEKGEVTVQPKIPDDWDYFMVENLWLAGKCYRVVFDKDGSHYGLGKGLQIICCE